MAKRFTDTEKWKREWFSELSMKAKLVWMYLLDNCDHTGVWHSNFKLMSFQLGTPVKKSEFETWFKHKLQLISSDKYFIRSFVEFQYGELKEGNNAHKAVLELLKKVGPHEPLNSPSRGAQDKDKEKDKDNVLGGSGGKKEYTPEFEKVWAAYPRRLDKSDSFDAFQKNIKPEDHAAFELAIVAYRKLLQETGAEKKFIKHFTTFANQDRWKDLITEGGPVDELKVVPKHRGIAEILADEGMSA